MHVIPQAKPAPSSSPYQPAGNTSYAHYENQKTLLNIGCGNSTKRFFPPSLLTSDWREISIDADAQFNPDIVASIVDLNPVSNHSVEAVISLHTLEHLPWHEVPLALSECRRVLMPDGFLLLSLPDVEQIAKIIARGGLMDTLYDSPSGPVTPFDMLMGHRESVAQGQTFMQHRSVFCANSLGNSLRTAGFSNIHVTRGTRFDLWALASMAPISDALLQEIKALCR